MLRFSVSQKENVCKIKIIGVGGGGGNAVNHMFSVGIKAVELITVNTDAQMLKHSKAPQRIQIGEKLTHGLGVGGIPELGRKAAEEDRQVLKETISDADMVFITGGFGGGTGTGAIPVLAGLCRELGILTVVVVTKPFEFEGKIRAQNAEDGLKHLEGKYDTLICIPNQRLFSVVDEKTSFLDAFKCVDDVLCRSVQSISSIITSPGLVNRDFNDVKTVMCNAGKALIGMGQGRGTNRALDAVESAVHSPLLEDITIEGAETVLVNIMAENISLKEVGEIMDLIKKSISPEANILYGHVVERNLKDEIKVTIIATRFPPAKAGGIKPLRAKQPPPAPLTERVLSEPTYLRRKEGKITI